jgi:hypothetical protein
MRSVAERVVGAEISDIRLSSIVALVNHVLANSASHAESFDAGRFESKHSFATPTTGRVLVPLRR